MSYLIEISISEENDRLIKTIRKFKLVNFKIKKNIFSKNLLFFFPITLKAEFHRRNEWNVSEAA